jgi:hypothetical protein
MLEYDYDMSSKCDECGEFSVMPERFDHELTEERGETVYVMQCRYCLHKEEV